LFPLFDGLEVADIDKPYEIEEATNGVAHANGVNGIHTPVSLENNPLVNDNSNNH
jgi:hypothetical protein